MCKGPTSAVVFTHTAKTSTPADCVIPPAPFRQQPEELFIVQQAENGSESKTVLAESKQTGNERVDGTAGNVIVLVTTTDDSLLKTVHDDEQKHALDAVEENDNMETSEGKDDESARDDDYELENLIARDWQGKATAVPLLRRQKRRQRQRANAKVGRALRRYVVSKGHRLSIMHQLQLDQAQREIVAFVDYIFGPLNLPNDTYLNTAILDPAYKSAMVASIVPFADIQTALAPLGVVLDAELQLAIVVDALRWSQSVRCGPVCAPDGEIIFCFRVKSVHQQQIWTEMSFPTDMAPPPVLIPQQMAVVAPATTMQGWLYLCGNCNQMIDTRFGYCVVCGVLF